MIDEHIITLLLLFSSILQHYVSTHEVNLGQCPKVDVVADFNFSKMLGLWYVIQKTKSSSSCTTLDFRNNSGKLTVAETSKPMGLSIPLLMENFSQVGSLKVPDPKQPAKMTVAFPFSLVPFSAVDLWIVDTDYHTYAATWSCRQIAALHRGSVMILSRHIVLDQDIVNNLRDKFQSFKINKHSLSIVEQRGCKKDLTTHVQDFGPESTTGPSEPATETHIVTTAQVQTITAPTETVFVTATAIPETGTVTGAPEGRVTIPISTTETGSSLPETGTATATEGKIPETETGTKTVIPETETRTKTVIPETETATVIPETETATVIPETETATVIPETETATVIPETETATVTTETGTETKI